MFESYEMYLFPLWLDGSNMNVEWVVENINKINMDAPLQWKLALTRIANYQCCFCMFSIVIVFVKSPLYWPKPPTCDDIWESSKWIITFLSPSRIKCCLLLLCNIAMRVQAIEEHCILGWCA